MSPQRGASDAARLVSQTRLQYAPASAGVARITGPLATISGVDALHDYGLSTTGRCPKHQGRPESDAQDQEVRHQTNPWTLWVRRVVAEYRVWCAPPASVRGHITHVYMGRMGDWPEFKMRCSDGSERTQTRQHNNPELDTLYRVGASVEIDYVVQYFKQASPFDTDAHDCVIEIRIGAEA